MSLPEVASSGWPGGGDESADGSDVLDIPGWGGVVIRREGLPRRISVTLGAWSAGDILGLRGVDID